MMVMLAFPGGETDLGSNPMLPFHHPWKLKNIPKLTQSLSLLHEEVVLPTAGLTCGR